MAVKATCSAGVLMSACRLSTVAAERLLTQQFTFFFYLISWRHFVDLAAGVA
jgi:hypothetical protein